MNFYDVDVDNGEEYEDFSSERYFIGAESEKEAEKLAIDMFEKLYSTARNVGVSTMNKTDNDIKVLISPK
jgi:hypothetical protein